jgi:hypothetical protein
MQQRKKSGDSAQRPRSKGNNEAKEGRKRRRRGEANYGFIKAASVEKKN